MSCVCFLDYTCHAVFVQACYVEHMFCFVILNMGFVLRQTCVFLVYMDHAVLVQACNVEHVYCFVSNICLLCRRYGPCVCFRLYVTCCFCASMLCQVCVLFANNNCFICQENFFLPIALFAK